MDEAENLLELAQTRVREIVPEADLAAMAVCFNLIRSYKLAITIASGGS